MAGRIAHAISFGENVDSTGDATQRYPLGQIRQEETSLAVGVETYRYVYFDNGAGNVAAAASAIAYRGITQAEPWDVTSDVSDVDSAFAAGVFQSVLADTQYGWIKTKGYVSALKKVTGTGQAWVKGDVLYAGADATDDGKAERLALTATTKVSGAEIRRVLERVIGWAAAAKSSTTATGAAYIEFE